MEDKKLLELREALKKDFKKLYVREFTTDWMIQRLLREGEINIMSLENTLSLLRAMKKYQIYARRRG